MACQRWAADLEKLKVMACLLRYAAEDHPMVISAGGVQMLGERKKWDQMEALTEVPSGLGQEGNPKAVHISNYHY